MPTPTGFSVKPSPAAGFQNLYKPASQGAEPTFIPTTNQTAPSTKTQDTTGLPSVPGGTGGMIPPQFNQLDKNGDGVLTPDEFNGGGGGGGGGDNLTIPTIPTAQVFTQDGIPDIPTAPVTNEKDDLLPPPPGTLSGPSNGVPPTVPTRTDVVDNDNNGPQEPSTGGDGDVPDFDDLQARFNALRGFK